VQDLLACGGLCFDSTALPSGRDGGWSILTYDPARQAVTLAAGDGGGGKPALWSAGGGPAGPVRLALAIPYDCIATFAGHGDGPPPDRRTNLQVRRRGRQKRKAGMQTEKQALGRQEDKQA
jgi:hypothetical protein